MVSSPAVHDDPVREDVVPRPAGRLAQWLGDDGEGRVVDVICPDCAATLAEGLRASVADLLDGRTPLAGIRRRTRAAFDGPNRVSRRAGEPDVDWYRGPWPVTVADVLAAGTDGYAATVERWARTVIETLDTRTG